MDTLQTPLRYSRFLGVEMDADLQTPELILKMWFGLEIKWFGPWSCKLYSKGGGWSKCGICVESENASF
jgi:hypothetical protein